MMGNYYVFSILVLDLVLTREWHHYLFSSQFNDYFASISL